MPWYVRDRITALTLYGIAAVLIAVAFMLWLLVAFWLGYLVFMVAWLAIIFASLLLWYTRRKMRR